MKAFENERVENRITLLYEMNRNSPIFARVAASELEKGNILSASEILENGIFHHPGYSTAYFIYAKVLAKLGKLDEAKYNLNKAKEILGSEHSYNEYLKIIESDDSADGDESETRGAAFLPNDYSEFDAVEDDIKLEEDLPDDNVLLDELENLAQELENAKMPPIEEAEFSTSTVEENNDESEIVTETLANIHLKQGHTAEAISVYEKLILQQPEKEQYFKIRIEEIKQSESD